MTIPFDQSKTVSTYSAPVGVVEIRTSRGLYRDVLKRGFDLLLLVMMLPIALPLIAVLALIIARDGGKPIYCSTRVGRNGREFGMLKLRTMVHNAEQALDSYLEECPEARAEWENSQKLKNDPRVTRFGQFLRKTSLDELPQLWNVLTGDMSLVGPRPMLPEQRAIYAGLAYYALRPGVTGLWQVSRRNEGGFDRRAEDDRLYDATLSFRGDLAILVRTIGVVLKGTGY